MSDRTYLAVPFAEKDKAKALGARFDRDTKSWFVPRGVEVTPFTAWLPDSTVPLAGHDCADPRAQFAAQLRDAGFVLGNQHPMMDGQIHHCPVDGGKNGERSGSYRAFSDGVPNGWFQNFKVHEKPVKWVMRTQVPEAIRPTVRALSAQRHDKRPMTWLRWGSSVYGTAGLMMSGHTSISSAKASRTPLDCGLPGSARQSPLTEGASRCRSPAAC